VVRVVARAAAELVMVLHFAVLLFLLVGGFFAWRWKAVLYAHLAMAAWAALIVAFPLSCPLTFAENFFRERAGMPVLRTGFIDTYIDGVLYPDRVAHLVQVLVGAIVLVSWAGLYLRWRGERRTTTHGLGAHAECRDRMA
jgi:hypothetical protein